VPDHCALKRLARRYFFEALGSEPERTREALAMIGFSRPGRRTSFA
jgi:hypothetical protein